MLNTHKNAHDTYVSKALARTLSMQPFVWKVPGTRLKKIGSIKKTMQVM